VHATLTYDLNRYNDRAFKDDQLEIGGCTLMLEVAPPQYVAPTAAPRSSP
jgi:hypothetical protein